MNPEIKRAWVKALRSGNYKQGQGALRQHDRFCCLGVLCDLAVKAGVDVEVALCQLTLNGYYRYDNESNYPPSKVNNWADIDYYEVPDGEQDPDADYQTISLADLNDGGTSFTEIANLIEEHL